MVETTLNAQPGVHEARVNLTLKRASIDADPAVTAEDLIGVLDKIGYPAHELDAGTIAATETD